MKGKLHPHVRKVIFTLAGAVGVIAVVFAIVFNNRIEVPGGSGFREEPDADHSETGEEAWQRGLRALERAETLSAYVQALKQISQSGFAGDPQVLSAAEAVSGQQDLLENWRQALLMPNDPEGWEAVLSSMTLTPETPLPAESRKFLDLLEADRYPSAFSQLHEREEELLRQWRAAGMIDSVEGRITIPLLRLVDELRLEEDINDLFRAYLHQQLGSIMRFHEHEWGLPLSPAFVNDLGELFQVAGEITPEHYLHPEDHIDTMILPIFRFYTERSGISYYEQALAFRSLFKKVMDGEMTFAGSVDLEGNLHLVKPAPEGRVLWALHKERGLSHIKTDSHEDRQPLSPVLFFSYEGKGERGLLEAVFEETGVNLTTREHREYLPPLARAATLPGSERYAFSTPLQRILAGASAANDDALSEDEEAHREIEAAVEAERARLLRWADEQEQRISRIERQERWRFFTEVQAALRNFDLLEDLLLGRRSEEVRYALGNPSRVDFNVWEYDDVIRYGASRQVLEIEFSGDEVTRVSRGSAGPGDG